MNVAFQGELVPFLVEFVFPLHTHSTLLRARQKPRRAGGAGELSPRIAGLLPLNPCDSQSCDPLPLRQLAFDSCCQQ